jgi:hypothetical protein
VSTLDGLTVEERGGPEGRQGRTYRVVHLTIVTHTGTEPREARLALPIPGDTVTEEELRNGRVSVYCRGIGDEKPLPADGSFGAFSEPG